MNGGDPVITAGASVASAMATAAVTEAIRRWKSRRDQAAAAVGAAAEGKKADADFVTSIGAAFEKLTNQLQEELEALRAERVAWGKERHELRNEVAKLRGLVSRLTKQLKANGLEPVLED